MKKTVKTVMLAAVATLTLGFAACSKDYAKDIAATYEGTLVMSVGDNAIGDPADAKVIVAAESENTVSLTLPQVGDGGMGMPSMTVEGVSVSKNKKVYSLSKNEISASVAGMEITGTLGGTVENDKLNLSYTLKPGSMPMSIDFTFTGK